MLLDLIDYLYALSLDKDIRKPNRLKFIPRNIIKYLVNIIVPYYYRITKFFYRLTPNENPEYVLSLTSFPARIASLHIVIESLIRQKKKPDRLILWLSNEQFDGEKSLPPSLLEQKKRGLEIRFVDDDLRPHKKYFYAMQEFPYANIITIDDDIFYPPKLIEYLVMTHKRYPYCICCNRAIRYTLSNGILKSYLDWDVVNKNTDVEPNFRLLPTGVGGVLYPSDSLNKDYLFNTNIIIQTCLYGDDLWLNLMARLKSTKTVISGKRIGLIPVLSTMKSALSTNNIYNGNDTQINRLIDYFGSETYMKHLKTKNQVYERN